MSSTTFVDGTTTIVASWLNDVNTSTYTTVPANTSAILTKLTSSNNLSDIPNATLARTNLGLGTAAIAAATSFAGSGANGNITSITGLTTPLGYTQGGTGLNSSGTSGNVLISTGTGWTSTAISTVSAPIGSIMQFGGSTPPAGYLVCPLSPTNVSRTTYAGLFAAIGTSWGVGDGSTTFGIPYFAQGLAGIQANGNVGTATIGAVIAHTHTYNTKSSTQPQTGSSTPCWVGDQTVNTGSTGGTNNYASGAYVLFCVKY